MLDFMFLRFAMHVLLFWVVFGVSCLLFGFSVFMFVLNFDESWFVGCFGYFV